MGMQRLPRALLRVACATLAVLVVACWHEESGDDRRVPVWIGMDDHPAKVIGESAWLRGEVECPECEDYSGWTYGNTCPAFQCPTVEGLVWWTNRANGATSPATHGTVPRCQCGSGYCSATCAHAWSASVPLAWGGNDIVVSATTPGYAQGNESTLIERVPATPAWLTPLADSGAVTLAWNASEGATSYNLYWSTTAHGTSGACTRIQNVTSPYRHSGLAGGVPHYYFVTALAGTAEGFDSERLTVTPQ